MRAAVVDQLAEEDAEEDALDDDEDVEVVIEWGVRLPVFVATAERDGDVEPDGVADRNPVGMALVGLGMAVCVEVEVGEAVAVGVAVWVPDAVIAAVDKPLSVEDRVDVGLRDVVKLLELELEPIVVGVMVELPVLLRPLGL